MNVTQNECTETKICNVYKNGSHITCVCVKLYNLVKIELSYIVIVPVKASNIKISICT